MARPAITGSRLDRETRAEITRWPQPIAAPAFVPALQGDPEWTPSHTMNRQVAKARREMGERRWAELNAEWL